MASTMRAVVFKGPHLVELEQDRPVPTLQSPTDIIVKIEYTALCGSDLHVYRGVEPCPPGVIMGHEFTGIVDQVGDAVRKVKVGDRIVSPFTVSCGDCFYCTNGYSSRCEKNLLYGSPALDGAQAQYIRVPLADGTVFPAPTTLPPQLLILMGDIFPTGYFAVSNGFSGLSPAQVASATVVVIGCGPVGLCAVLNAAERRPKNLFAVDAVPDRLEQARALGAEPLDFTAGDGKTWMERVREASDGRGADIVVEVVGNEAALRMGFDVLRDWGMLSSVGVHNSPIPWSGTEAYNKNVRVQMGRCPVRSIFADALEVLEQRQELLGFMTANIMPLSRAVEAYDMFDKRKVQKIVFEAQK